MLPVCNLDDPKRLVTLRLRPSEVVTREYVRSRAWARRIYEASKWTGVQWWSYYDSKWASYGLWDVRRMRLDAITVLTLEYPALLEAGRTIVRRVG
jgi:hypothetical protein